MARTIPWDSIPKPKPPGFDKGAYLFEIENMEDSDYQGRYTVNATYRCIAPDSDAGKLHFQTYYIGTDNDPEANDPKTLTDSRDLSNLKEHLLQAGAPLAGSTEKTFAKAMGRKLGFIFGEYVVKATRADGTPNANAGEVKTVIRKAFKEGEVPPSGAAAGAPAKPKPKLAAAPVKAARVEDDDDEAPKPKAKRPAEKYDDEDDD